MIEVRGSEVDTFLDCRLKWHYQWKEGLKPKRPNGKLWFGTLFHKYLETYYITGDHNEAYDEMWKLFTDTDTSNMEQVAIDETWEMAENISLNYYDHWKDVDRCFKTVATELSFRIPLNDDILYYGTIDRIYLDEDDRLWFMDHKTVTSMDQYQDKAEMDRQISRYWWAIQQLIDGRGEVLEGDQWLSVIGSKVHVNGNGKDIAGFIYNLIRKEYPEAPKILKSGKPSTDKRQKTTYALYVKVLEELGLMYESGLPVDASYLEMLRHLEEQDQNENNRWFRRVEVFRTQGEVDASINELIDIVYDMQDPRIYRRISDECGWKCDYKGLCVAGMDGGNVDMLKDLMFTKEEK